MSAPSLGLVHRTVVAMAALLLLLAAGPAAADPPERAGRLSYVEGTVSFRAVDQTEWSPATVNYPVTTGHSFWAEPEARAEIQVGPVELRLDHSTELEVLRLDEAATRFRLRQGMLNVRVRDLPPGGLHIETTQGTAELRQPGRYRVDVWPPDDTPIEAVQVSVFEGAASFSGPDSTLDISPGERAVIEGDPPIATKVAAELTPFDEWALARERSLSAAETARHVSPHVTGHQDLDAHGRWRTVPDYGPVWYPAGLPPGWAPYRHGHWAYVPPWGWTWIDDAPWGFAPFHYGRWVSIDGHWAWWPGTYVARPVYAPALVVFVGGISHSHIGWVPLGPREVFRPYYPCSVTHVHRLNRAVVHHVTSAKHHRDVKHFAHHRAATIVPASTVTDAKPVHRSATRASAEQLAQARTATNVAHLSPSKAARAGGGKAAESRAPAPRPAASPSASRGDRPQARDAPATRSLSPSRPPSSGQEDDRRPSTAAVPRAPDSAGRLPEPPSRDLRRDESHPRDTRPPAARRDDDAVPRRPSGATRAPSPPAAPVVPRTEAPAPRPSGAPAPPSRPPTARQEDRLPSTANRPPSPTPPTSVPRSVEPRREAAPPPSAAPAPPSRPPTARQEDRPPSTAVRPPTATPPTPPPRSPAPRREAAPPPSASPAPPSRPPSAPPPSVNRPPPIAAPSAPRVAPPAPPRQAAPPPRHAAPTAPPRQAAPPPPRAAAPAPAPRSAPRSNPPSSQKPAERKR